MTEATWDVRELSPDDWQLLRDARLAALDESPHAFLSAYADEVAWGEDKWRHTLETANWLAVGETPLLGVLRSFRDPDQPWLWQVESSWVAPTHRELGIFRALLHDLVSRLRCIGASGLLLWVFADNHPAWRVYRKLGFEPTGEYQTLPGDRVEMRLRRGIALPLAI